jgi:hypothetical protein
LSGSRMRENRPSGLMSGMWKRQLSELTAPHLDSTGFRQLGGVAQASSLLYRGFPIRRCDQAGTACRLEVGDTAGWKPALPRLGSPATLLGSISGFRENWFLVVLIAVLRLSLSFTQSRPRRQIQCQDNCDSDSGGRNMALIGGGSFWRHPGRPPWLGLKVWRVGQLATGWRVLHGSGVGW